MAAGVLLWQRSVPLYQDVIELAGYYMEKMACAYRKKRRPQRIILLRHGESIANLDSCVYAKLPDNQIPLSDRGR
jgi:hypothetical protein